MTDLLTPIAQPAIVHTTPMGESLAAPLHPTDDQRAHDTHRAPVVGGDDLRPGQTLCETQTVTAGSDPSADSNDQRIYDAHDGYVVAVGHSSSHPPAIRGTTPKQPTPGGWLELRVWAEMFDDAQKARIANVNRAERGGADPDVFAAHIAALHTTEHNCRLMLRRTFRKMAPEPIKDWEKASTGIGIDMLGRLLGHLGHPVHATPHHWQGTGSNRVLVDDPPYDRTVGQLWQFCGHGAPGRKWKGMTADDLAAQGKPTLKMLLHLMAENAIKEPGRSTLELLAGHQDPDDCLWPYRRVYEVSRLATAEKVHSVECVRCGPSGKPAQVCSPWSAGHQHAHALRITGKEILRDIWTVTA